MTKYRVGVDEFEELAELEQSWMPADYVSILTSLDIADAGKMDVDELRDMTLFALQDLNPPDAAAIVEVQGGDKTQCWADSKLQHRKSTRTPVGTVC